MGVARAGGRSKKDSIALDVDGAQRVKSLENVGNESCDRFNNMGESTLFGVLYTVYSESSKEDAEDSLEILRGTTLDKIVCSGMELMQSNGIIGEVIFDRSVVFCSNTVGGK